MNGGEIDGLRAVAWDSRVRDLFQLSDDGNGGNDGNDGNDDDGTVDEDLPCDGSNGKEEEGED